MATQSCRKRRKVSVQQGRREGGNVERLGTPAADQQEQESPQLECAE